MKAKLLFIRIIILILSAADTSILLADDPQLKEMSVRRQRPEPADQGDRYHIKNASLLIDDTLEAEAHPLLTGLGIPTVGRYGKDIRVEIMEMTLLASGEVILKSRVISTAVPPARIPESGRPVTKTFDSPADFNDFVGALKPALLRKQNEIPLLIPARLVARRTNRGPSRQLTPLREMTGTSRRRGINRLPLSEMTGPGALERFVGAQHPLRRPGSQRRCLRDAISLPL